MPLIIMKHFAKPPTLLMGCPKMTSINIFGNILLFYFLNIPIIVNMVIFIGSQFFIIVKTYYNPYFFEQRMAYTKCKYLAHSKGRKVLYVP
jgi:hypothetical protein